MNNIKLTSFTIQSGDYHTTATVEFEFVDRPLHFKSSMEIIAKEIEDAINKVVDEEKIWEAI